jgi:hypothetical protein
MNAIQKQLSGLKKCSPKASRSISRVSVAHLLSFTKNLMQTCCSILPSITDKTKYEVKKALMKKQCVFIAWCHVADWCNRLPEVWPWPCLSSSFTEAVITVWELSDTTSYLYIIFFQDLSITLHEWWLW